MEKKYLTLPLGEFKQSSEEDEFFRFEGYLSTYNNVDLGDDIMLEGAFDKSLASKRPNSVKVLYQHDPSRPLGVFENITSDVKGLYVKAKMPKENSMVKDVMCLMKCGAIDSMSIGYSTVEYDYNKQGKRILKEVDLWEGSLVTFPMNTEALVTGMKNAKFDIDDIKHIKTKRDFERCLRDSGIFSARAAVRLASHFSRESEIDALTKQIEGLTKLIK